MKIRAYFRKLVLSFLGLSDHEALIAGLRRDHDAVATNTKGIVASVGVSLDDLNARANDAVRHLNDLHTRLNHYERTVPSLVKARKLLIDRIKRERAKQAQTAEPGDESAIAGEIAPAAEMDVTDGVEGGAA